MPFRPTFPTTCRPPAGAIAKRFGGGGLAPIVVTVILTAVIIDPGQYLSGLESP
jgi:hypothetical protein